ncbi:hypothetical protein LEP1GSC052_4036 [Leptospira kmetyi serovar Malaysia str. Bejo-Iso9]|nr:hypothetical protein LEP1GSC052_4036 [Leptospira kmetyi serovar Malaysia str. Bejo-Iso9]
MSAFFIFRPGKPKNPIWQESLEADSPVYARRIGLQRANRL